MILLWDQKVAKAYFDVLLGILINDNYFMFIWLLNIKLY